MCRDAIVDCFLSKYNYARVVSIYVTLHSGSSVLIISIL